LLHFPSPDLVQDTFFLRFLLVRTTTHLNITPLHTLPIFMSTFRLFLKMEAARSSETLVSNHHNNTI
jgi:hypothetical protein